MNKTLIIFMHLALIFLLVGSLFILNQNNKKDNCIFSIALGLKLCDNFDYLDTTGCYEQCYMDYGILSGENVLCTEKHNKIKLVCNNKTIAIRFVNCVEDEQ